MARLHDRWSELIDRLGLNLSAPVNYLTAGQIHQHLGVEPRLLASMDSKSKLPTRLRDEGVFVVPLTRSRYALVRGHGYHELEDPGEPERYEARLPTVLTTLAYGRGENRFLLHAYHTGLLSRFTEVPSFYQTVSGKMGTGSFSYHVNGSPELEVRSAGMELDAGFEGQHDVLLFEGKATVRRDFLIRQLYYPYRTFREWSSHKRVRSFFFVADPETTIYSMWEYEWTDPEDYESIRCVRRARYRVEVAEFDGDPLLEIAPDPSVDIVPQADDLQKVVDLPLLVQSGVVTAQEWADHYGITTRQGSYYREAAGALGLVKLEEGRFVLTADGRRYVGLPQDQRERLVAERLLRNPLLNEAYRSVLAKGVEGLTDTEVARLIEERSHLRGSTPMRRAKSVRSYLKWLGQATGAIVVADRRVFSREGWETRGKAA